MTSVEDVESQKAAGRTRCSTGVCLTGAVLVLYALVLAAGAAGFWMVKGLREDVERERQPAKPEARVEQRGLGSRYKVHNLAHLRPTSSVVEKSKTMTWEPIAFGKGNTVGSRFSYDSSQSSLTVLQGGSYFMYVQLNLSCVYQCAPGPLRIEVEDQDQIKHLDCIVDLPETLQSVTKKCWTVIPFLESNSRLLARMSTEMNPNNWKIELNQSEFGMFLVDGPETD